MGKTKRRALVARPWSIGLLARGLILISLWASAAVAQDAHQASARLQNVAPRNDANQELSQSSPMRDARATLFAWADAWSSQDPDRYLSFYARSFQPSNPTSRAAWEAKRRERIAQPRIIEIELADMVIMVYRDHTEATFLQSYRSNTYRDQVQKRLELVWEQGQWKIRVERVIEAEAAAEKSPNHP